MTAQVVAQLPITFKCVDGTTTHAPLIVTSVRGAAVARYILDTGSEVHLINEDLAEELSVRPPMHDTQAIVGMDAPRGTVLAFARDLARPVFRLVRA